MNEHETIWPPAPQRVGMSAGAPPHRGDGGSNALGWLALVFAAPGLLLEPALRANLDYFHSCALSARLPPRGWMMVINGLMPLLGLVLSVRVRRTRVGRVVMICLIAYFALVLLGAITRWY